MNQLTLSGRGLLGFEPIRRGFGGFGVVLQQHAEEEGRPLFGVFTAQQRIPARLLTHTQETNHSQQDKNYLYWSQRAEAGCQWSAPTDGEEVYLLDLLHRSEVQDDVADTLSLLTHRVDGKTLKLDGSSLQSERTESPRCISVTQFGKILTESNTRGGKRRSTRQQI